MPLLLGARQNTTSVEKKDSPLRVVGRVRLKAPLLSQTCSAPFFPVDEGLTHSPAGILRRRLTNASN